MSKVKVKFEVVEEFKGTTVDAIKQEAEDIVAKVQSVIPSATFQDLEVVPDEPDVPAE